MLLNPLSKEPGLFAVPGGAPETGAAGMLAPVGLLIPMPAIISMYGTMLRAYCWSVVPMVRANSRNLNPFGARMIACVAVRVAVSGALVTLSNQVDPFGSTISIP